MLSYSEAYRTFSADALAKEVLLGSLEHGLNACVECCDRWATNGRVALHWMSTDFQRRSITFAELAAESAKFANVLTARGIRPGDVVAGMIPRVPELLVVMLGTWRAGAIYLLISAES